MFDGYFMFLQGMLYVLEKMQCHQLKLSILHKNFKKYPQVDILKRIDFLQHKSRTVIRFHELDAVLQEVLQPVDLVGLFLDPLSALKEVVASFGLGAISFTFLASKHGWDKVHPLAVLVSIPILSIAL